MKISSFFAPENRNTLLAVSGIVCFFLAHYFTGFILVGLIMMGTLTFRWLRRKFAKLAWVPIALFLLAIFAFSPLLIGITAMAISEAAYGTSLNESNSVWGVLPWMTFFTVSAAGSILPFIIAGAAVHSEIIAKKKKKSPLSDIILP